MTSCWICSVPIPALARQRMAGQRRDRNSAHRVPGTMGPRGISDNVRSPGSSPGRVTHRCAVGRGIGQRITDVGRRGATRSAQPELERATLAACPLGLADSCGRPGDQAQSAPISPGAAFLYGCDHPASRPRRCGGVDFRRRRRDEPHRLRRTIRHRDRQCAVPLPRRGRSAGLCRRPSPCDMLTGAILVVIEADVGLPARTRALALRS